MAEPNWELWEQSLRGLRCDMAVVCADVTDLKSQRQSVEDEGKGLKRMYQMSLGTASGADFVAERAEQAAERANKRRDALIDALRGKDIHVDA